MIWYRNLYVGETARKRKHEIVWKVKHKAGMLGVYLISLSSNQENLLDIIDSSMLIQPYYEKEDIFIVGIACGYDEALELTTRIIETLYKKTGDFKIRQYLTNER
ncbi:hypothetical protein C8E03_10137 [Lachnotalea glycerini]|uniref:Uncharacterized protein n=1 Tax=Lachnotalea glycerini TaxID=1763509 RepID=A0A318F0J1_9FIRM|nr:hypothetical protein [Lachnotalea glycerini]OYO51279.1 hypothetical protein CG709_19940 [Lachnotalea glycerini]PXV95408.1 hypothetical protein C8E03_10137 [Lachnotalea glycerini]